MRRQHNRRLSDETLAARLVANDLVDQGTIDTLRGRCGEDGALSGAVVESGVMGDWELGRWVSRFFARPFLPLEVCSPSPDAIKGLDVTELIKQRLVPLWRCSAGLVVAMPGISSEAALSALSEDAGCPIYAVIGSVWGNRQWLEERLPQAPLPSGEEEGREQWSLLLGLGDAQAREIFKED